MQHLIHQSLKRAGAVGLASSAAMTATIGHAQDIPVASIQAMTGPAALAGVHDQNSIRMAVEEFNHKGGVGGQKDQRRPT